MYRLYNNKYIDTNRNSSSDIINSLDIGNLFYDDIHKDSFVIVNDSDTKHRYEVNASGSNTGISGNLTIAFDDISSDNYSGQISFYIEAYDRETIYFKYTVENAPVLGSGNIFIGIKEI